LKNINPGGREKSVLFVGRLCDKDKNISGLLRIWAKTNKDGWTLKLVGDGEDKQYLEDYAKQLGVSSSVEFVGWVDTPMEIMTTSSLFCMTSHIEGFALVLIEAMACGLPVVSYDLPYGPSDIITDGIDGYLIPNGDEQVFADRLSQCLANEDRIAPMSVAAIEKSKQFDVDTITDLWIKKYNELLSSKG
jgi:glycosyltransferase involved in cell wall biosynthesis